MVRVDIGSCIYPDITDINLLLLLILVLGFASGSCNNNDNLLIVGFKTMHVATSYRNPYSVHEEYIYC